MALGLKDRLAVPGIVITPGVFDMLSLRIAAQTGLEALYMTGYGVAASYLGLPDAGLATYTDIVGRVSAMVAASPVPLITDGDTGFGGLLHVGHTVAGYEAAGAAAIQIEDQEFSKMQTHVRPSNDRRQSHGQKNRGCRRGTPQPGFPDHCADGRLLKSWT